LGVPDFEEIPMPRKVTLERARRDRRQGKSPSTQAGEFVREQIDAIRAGKHGARSAKQAIAIGLSEARRAGVALAPPKKGRASAATRRKAALDSRRGRKHPVRGEADVSPRRSAATTRALKREGTSAASRSALSRQARAAASRRSAADRSRSARKAARTRHARESRPSA
jgi:hypothetical protein